MQCSEAQKIYNDSIKYELPIEVILQMEDKSQQEFNEAFKPIEGKHIKMGYEEDESYRDFQESNFNEYFDWASTYRYRLYK